MKTNSPKPFIVIDSISQITRKLQGSKLDPKNLIGIKIHVRKLKAYLNVSEQQAMLFTAFFVLQIRQNSIDLSDIVNYLNLETADLIRLKMDIDMLLERDLIETEFEPKKKKSKKQRFRQSDFIIPFHVAEAIYSNSPIENQTEEIMDIFGFAHKVSDHIQKREDEQIETFELFGLVLDLESENNHLEALSKVIPILEIEERTLLYEMINDHTKGHPTSINKTLQDIYENIRIRMRKIRELIEEKNIMFNLDLIALDESRFANDAVLHLTAKSLEMMLGEDAGLFMPENKYKNIILNKDIVTKELFYDNALSTEVNFLSQSLINDKFNSLQDRLVKMKLSKGVAAIFYGAPGTGKTETAFQIAKATGRDVLLVDISQTKSMWFGESEKRIKLLFDTYRRICSTAEMIPILLFNEADALLSKRKNNNKSNVGQTENTIQNIFLEEIERFEGIMIATTNLAGNLDSAYERRFLFKIKFENPPTEIKQKIWHNKLEWLDDCHVEKLAKVFSFTGGEIDNIVRKITMQEVINGIRPEIDQIVQFCKSERLHTNDGGLKVGYL